MTLIPYTTHAGDSLTISWQQDTLNSSGRINFEGTAWKTLTSVVAVLHEQLVRIDFQYSNVFIS